VDPYHAGWAFEHDNFGMVTMCVDLRSAELAAEANPAHATMATIFARLEYSPRREIMRYFRAKIPVGQAQHPRIPGVCRGNR
jgi:hypothetical protein